MTKDQLRKMQAGRRRATEKRKLAAKLEALFEDMGGVPVELMDLWREFWDKAQSPRPCTDGNHGAPCPICTQDFCAWCTETDSRCRRAELALERRTA